MSPPACYSGDIRQAMWAERHVTSLRWRVVLQPRRSASVLFLRSVKGVRTDDNPSSQVASWLGAPAEGGPVAAERQPAAHRVQAARLACAVPHVYVVLRVAQRPGNHPFPHHFCRVGLRAVGNDDRPAMKKMSEKPARQAVHRHLVQRLAGAPYHDLYAGALRRGKVFGFFQPHCICGLRLWLLRYKPELSLCSVLP